MSPVCAFFEILVNTIPNCAIYHSYIRGLDIVEHEDGVSKKQAKRNRSMCIEPGEGPPMKIPTAKCASSNFEEYNAEALRIFFEHATHCLWCREKNMEAIENARHAEEEARLKAEKEAADKRAQDESEHEAELRRLAEEEEARKRADEDALKRALEEEEAHRKAEEEEEAHRLAEEAARRKHEEELREAKEAARRRAEEAARRRTAELAALQLTTHKLAEAVVQAAIDEGKRLAANVEDEDAKLIRLLKEEEEARRARAAEEAAHRKRVASGHHKYLKKREGAMAHAKSGEAYVKQKQEEQARHDIAHFSLKHAQEEGLVAATSNKVSPEKQPSVIFKEVDCSAEEAARLEAELAMMTAKKSYCAPE